MNQPLGHRAGHWRRGHRPRALPSARMRPFPADSGHASASLTTHGAPPGQTSRSRRFCRPGETAGGNKICITEVSTVSGNPIAV